MNNILLIVLFANSILQGKKVNSWVVTDAQKTALKIHSNSLLNVNDNFPVLLLPHTGGR